MPAIWIAAAILLLAASLDGNPGFKPTSVIDHEIELRDAR